VIYANADFLCAFPVGSIRAFAMVQTMSMIIFLQQAYNIPTEPQLEYEMFIKDGSIPVHKFCNADRTLNIKFEIP